MSSRVGPLSPRLSANMLSVNDCFPLGRLAIWQSKLAQSCFKCQQLLQLMTAVAVTCRINSVTPYKRPV